MKNKSLLISNKVKVGILFTVFALLLNVSLQAQEITVTGTVTSSEDGMPIPGAAVVIKGTMTGTTSDFDGNYSINAKTGDLLDFSFIGMVSQSVTIKGNKIDIIMLPAFEDLDEVVVVGYGTVKKKEVTGAVAQVKAEQIEQFVTSDMASALQGQIAGVNVVANSGEPGANSSIQIRGVTSLSGSNTPLYVVDGIPQQGDPGISPNEIETIDVLKDGASAAVYGTRGAAGVILITTKRGEEGKATVSFNTSYGVQSLGAGIPLMNTEQQLFYEITKLNNGATQFLPATTRNPEWLSNDNTFDDYVLNNGASTKQHTLNVAGGTKNLTYNAVGGYYNQEGSLINSGFTRINGRATTSYKSDNWNIDASIAFTTEKRKVTSEGLIVNAIRYYPYYPLINSDSDIVYSDGSGGVQTPLDILARALKRKDNRTRDRINASLSINRKFTDELSFTTRIGTAITNDIQNIFIPKYTVINIEDGSEETDVTKSEVSANSVRSTTLSWDGSLNFKKKFGKHNFGAQATLAIEENSRAEFTALKQGVLNNNIEVLNGTSVFPQSFSGGNFGTGNWRNTLMGMLGRVTYDYEGKYLFSALVRRDGSSKFGKNNQWGVFPSMSLAWNVSDEGFWDNIKSTINNFKIRASYGTVGNNSFDDYEYASNLVSGTDYIFDPNDGSVNYGSAIKSYANRDVKWEKSVSKNIGVDLALLKNKITINADYYVTDKEDMLFPVELPGSAGGYYDSSIILNIGNMTNKGLEIGTNYRTSIGKSKLNIGGTFTKNQNTITKMFGSSLIYNSNSALIAGDGNSVVTVLGEGYEVGAFFLYPTNGTIQTQEQLDAYLLYPSRASAKLGDLMYIDTNLDGNIDVNDRKYMGSGLPDFELGFNFKWEYKNFDLLMNWYGTVGAEILNGTKAATYSFGRHTDLVNQWSADNTSSNIPLHNGDSKSGSFNYVGTTDYWLENGDYLRLKLLSLGFNLPKDVSEKIGISNLRLYVSGQNVFTITGYDGYDPEIGGNVARRGLDTSRYPLTALYTLGLDIKF